MSAKEKKVALFDLDGTLSDYFKALTADLKKLRSPHEKPFSLPIEDNAPAYMKNRKKLIVGSESWWANLPKFKLGWDILNLAEKMGFRIVILTKASSKNPASYSGKKIWVNKYLKEGIEMIIASSKGLVYGKILVDDYPGFIKDWLKFRPRGLVIMPASNLNKNFKHKQVIRYTGKNLKEVKRAMKLALLD